MAIYYALTGAKKVSGFDLSSVSVELGNDRIKKQKLDNLLDNLVKLKAMDATKLNYEDNQFDLVIGHAVIHHVIKYPNIFEKLYRVMRPGAKAYFLEGLADFWIWKLHWIKMGEVEAGDVPIFSKEVRSKAAMFKTVNIIGDTLFYSLKAFWKRRPGKTGVKLLRCLHKIDEKVFKVIPYTRKFGSFSYIELIK